MQISMKDKRRSALGLISSVALLGIASGAQAQAVYPNEKTYNDRATSTPQWKADQRRRAEAIEKHLSDKQIAYRWFADFPFGERSGAPFLILKLLPKLAPEEWGSEENFLDVVGLFIDEREPGLPIARGFGWTGLARKDTFGAVDFASITCGACHIGRVRLDDGKYKYLDGGVNTQFNLVQYRRRVVNTIRKITAGATTPEEKISRAAAAILAAMDKAHAADKNFFYRNYALGARNFDAEYEEKQIALFRKDAARIVGDFLQRAELEFSSLVDLIGKNYKGFEEPMAQGFGGMADATGVSASIVFAFQKAAGKPVDAETMLPPTAGITDFMAVWEQGKRRAHWSTDGASLIDGGGQWNGNIPIPIFRNLAAELTVGLFEDTDLRVGVFGVDLLADLPAPAYPFDVDVALARKGEALFNENCAACHKPQNGNVYDMGTDLGRARVVSQTIATSARASFTKICPPSRAVEMPPDGDMVRPCAEFDHVSLENRPELSMADPKDHLGYNALPLGGVWAQAPYLHNGSVPTLYHLLVPVERPRVFMKGRLDYDRSLGGFSWNVGAAPRREEGYSFDTGAFPALSNHGHDKDVEVDGRKMKLDWSDDKAGATAIVEYLKTR